MELNIVHSFHFFFNNSVTVDRHAKSTRLHYCRSLSQYTCSPFTPAVFFLSMSTLKHLWSFHSKPLEISYRTGSFKPCSNNKNSAEVGFMYEVYLNSDIFHQTVCVSVSPVGQDLPQFGSRWR